MEDSTEISTRFPEQWYEWNPDLDKAYEALMTEPRRIAGKPPRGYIVDSDNKQLGYPDKTRLDGYITALLECRQLRQRSLRETTKIIDKIEADAGSDNVTISTAGLCLLLDRTERDLGLFIPKADGKQRAVKKKTAEMRKKDGTYKKATKHHPTTANKKKIEERRKLSATNKELQKIEKERKALIRKSARQARKLELKDDPTKYGIIDESTTVIEMPITAPEIITTPTPINLIENYQAALVAGEDETFLMEMYQEIMAKKERFQKRQVAFLPTPRQYLFMSAGEDVVLYGGAAGGGKSFAMVLDAIRHADVSYYKAVIIRKTTPELKELIDNSRELYPLAFPGAKFNSSTNTWRFPSGAQVMFGFLDSPNDKLKYQGISYQYIGFDELSAQNTDEGFHYVRSRARSAEHQVYPYVRATANPGSQWVYEQFIKDREPMSTFILPASVGSSRPLTAKFIPAKLEDNPHLNNDGMYRAVLESMTEIDRKQLLEGDWLASVDSMFPEFNIHEHIIAPFDVPRDWSRVAGLDYGYRDPSAGVWFAIDPTDGAIIVYDEFLETGLTGLEFARAIERKEQDELMLVDHPIDWSVFARTGHTGPTIAESMLSLPGLRLRPADKNREAGWVQIHEALRNDPVTGQPKIKIFSTCTGLIKQLLNAKSDPNKPNDLKATRNKDGHWDLLDALRYGVMSRPKKVSYVNDLRNIKSSSWDRINSYFT